jgi:hypothetical protein
MSRIRNHAFPGKFNWRCLLRHAWGEWSRPILRTHVAGGLLGDSYLWEQRRCSRCGAGQGKEYPGADE